MLHIETTKPDQLNGRLWSVFNEFSEILCDCREYNPERSVENFRDVFRTLPSIYDGTFGKNG